MKKLLWVLGASALMAAAVVVAQPRRSVEQLAGKPVPAFRFVDTKGKVHTNQTLRGRAVLIDFWATWCGPCKAASPTMQNLHRKYASKGLVVIGANVFEDEDAKGAAAKYAKQHKYTYTFVPQADAVAERWGVSGVPAFIFIDRRGNVRFVETGFAPRDAARFEQQVRTILAR